MIEPVRASQLLIALCATAIAGSVACRKPAPGNAAIGAEVSANASPSDTAPVAILDRGPCRGFCPTYHVTLYADGTVKFDGRKNVQAIGLHQGTANIAAIQNFLSAARAEGFAALDASYEMDSAGCGQYVTDLPVSSIAVRVGSTLKTVRHDPGCRGAPQLLTSLEFRLDSIANTARWVTGNGEKK